MAKFSGLGARSLAEYLASVVDDDWKHEDETVVKRERTPEERAEALQKDVDLCKAEIDNIPPERRWQFKAGVAAFWQGKSLRECGDEVTYEDSRRLWRMGWVSQCRKHIESRGGMWTHGPKKS